MIPGSVTPLLLKSATAGGLQIERSLRFNSSDSAYLSRVFAVAGNRRTWTWSGWVKRSALGSTYQIFSSRPTSSPYALIYFSSEKLNYAEAGVSLATSPVFRDVSAWYHIVIATDTTQATSSDRVKFYVNGVRITAFDLATYPTQNYDTQINTATQHNISGALPVTAEYFDGYLANIHFIDGQQLTPSSFTETDATTGQLIPKTYTGTYGLVADSTGALPIFNTTGAQGAVKDTGTRTDSNSASIVLAVPMDGTNGGTTFTDESATIKGSGSPKSLTVNNATTSTSAPKYYGSSGNFDGVASLKYLSFSPGTDLAFGTGDFTIEAWVNMTSRTTSNNQFVFNTSGGTQIALFQGLSYGYEKPVIRVGATDINASTAVVTYGTWQHWAATRSGSTVRLFINGVLQSTGSDSTNVTAQTTAYVGGSGSLATSNTNGYIQDFRIYKGVAKYTSNFIVPTPNSFNLLFADNSSNTASTLGKDSSPNANNFTPTNLSVTAGAGNDSLVDSPTNYGTDTGVGGEVRGNYCTLNPLQKNTSLTISNGNLDAVGAGSNQATYGTIGVSSGKWYWEVLANGGMDIGIANASGITLTTYVGSTASSYAYDANGNKYNNGSGSAYGASFTTNDVIGVAFDADNGTLTFYKNGTSQGQAFSSLTSGPYFPAFSTATASYSANFGQRAFAYTAPSGFKALCTQNLPEGTITTSGSFTGNANADGPFVYLNGVPTAMTINSNAVTFATHADKLSNGFKLRTSSGSYNTAGSNTYSITTTGDKFKYARAQPNP